MARHVERGDEPEEDLESLRVALRQERGPAPEQAAGRAEVTARVRSAAGGGKSRGCATGEVVETGIGAVEFGPVAVGALQVVADDLVLLDERRVPIEPVGKGLVQRGPGLLRERVVRSVADQEVAEAECLLVRIGRLVGSDHLLADEREEVGGHLVAFGEWRQLVHGAAVEYLSLD